MADTTALPIRIGLLYDFPQADDLFASTLQLGIDDVVVDVIRDLAPNFTAANFDHHR